MSCVSAENFFFPRSCCWDSKKVHMAALEFQSGGTRVCSLYPQAVLLRSQCNFFFFYLNAENLFFKLNTPNDGDFFFFGLSSRLYRGDTWDSILSHKPRAIFKTKGLFFFSSRQDGGWAQMTGSLHHVISGRNKCTKEEWSAWNYNLKEKETQHKTLTWRWYWGRGQAWCKPGYLVPGASILKEPSFLSSIHQDQHMRNLLFHLISTLPE